MENAPLSPDDLARAHALWPELAELSAALRAYYPLPIAGWHQLHFGDVTLTLGLGDGLDLLRSIDTQVDAWFLDGFAPAKNPDLWTRDMAAQIERLSAADATLASFTAAGEVRRALAEVGFTIERKAGYGHKRHRIEGCRESLVVSRELSVEETQKAPQRSEGSEAQARGGPVCVAHGRKQTTPLCERCELKKILVVGAGIAGASVAHALAERGCKVTVIDAAENAASGASGNKAAVLYPQLTLHASAQSGWYLHAYAHAMRWLSFLSLPPCGGGQGCGVEQNISSAPSPSNPTPSQGEGETCSSIGMLMQPKDAKHEARYRGANVTHGVGESVMRYVERAEAEALLGVMLKQGGLWWPQGTWVNPPALIRQLLAHPNITTHMGCVLDSMIRTSEGWELTTSLGPMQASVVVLANAHHAQRFVPALRINPSAGQVSYVPREDVVTPLRAILCHKGYMIPHTSGVLIGATYDHQDFSGAVTAQNHRKNAEEANAAVAGFTHANSEAWQGRTSMRATTPDRLPYVGEVEQGLYVSAGHGSRGMLSAPLAAEIIASQMMGEMIPLPREVWQAVDVKRVMKK